MGIPWKSALAYCRSVGGTLPTEAQWEYAARGPKLRPNLWGAHPVDPLRTAVLLGKAPKLRPVCQADQDVVRYGKGRLCDLAANALEWTLGPFVHPSKPAAPPAGFPFGGAKARYWRAVRGIPPLLETNRVPAAAGAYRAPGCVSPSHCPADRLKQLSYTGFRCARPLGR